MILIRVANISFALHIVQMFQNPFVILRTLIRLMIQKSKNAV